jgi:hypothetical protein
MHSHSPTPFFTCQGHTALHHKLAALVHTIMLDVGPEPRSIQRYCNRVITLCSDLGTEHHLADVPAINLEDLLERFASDAGLQSLADTPAAW